MSENSAATAARAVAPKNAPAARFGGKGLNVAIASLPW